MSPREDHIAMIDLEVPLNLLAAIEIETVKDTAVTTIEASGANTPHLLPKIRTTPLFTMIRISLMPLRADIWILI
jgi:hypothetical protein